MCAKCNTSIIYWSFCVLNLHIASLFLLEKSFTGKTTTVVIVVFWWPPPLPPDWSPSSGSRVCVSGPPRHLETPRPTCARVSAARSSDRPAEPPGYIGRRRRGGHLARAAAAACPSHVPRAKWRRSKTKHGMTRGGATRAIVLGSESVIWIWSDLIWSGSVGARIEKGWRLK